LEKLIGSLSAEKPKVLKLLCCGTGDKSVLDPRIDKTVSHESTLFLNFIPAKGKGFPFFSLNKSVLRQRDSLCLFGSACVRV